METGRIEDTVTLVKDGEVIERMLPEDALQFANSVIEQADAVLKATSDGGI